MKEPDELKLINDKLDELSHSIKDSDVSIEKAFEINELTDIAIQKACEYFKNTVDQS